MELGVIVENLRCDDIWVGTNGIAKINTFSCVLLPPNAQVGAQNVRWQAPEVIRGHPSSATSNIFALGMCALEAVTGQVPWGEAKTNSSVSSEVVRDFRPKLSEELLTKSRRDLLDQMWSVESSKRPHRLPSDAAVVSYCEVLLRLDRFLGNAIYERSMLLRAKSRKVALQSNVFHRRLDELLELLAPPTIDPTHEWQEHVKLFGESVQSESSAVNEQVPSDGGEESVPTPGQAAATGSNGPAATITRYESDRLNERFRELDFETIRAASVSEDASGLPWLIRSYDLQYDRDDQIGNGAFGKVYKATWRGTPVVVKFMGYEADDDASRNELFFYELRAWFLLSHPHIVKLYDACHIGKVFFVCEFAGNGNLAAYLKRDGNANKSWQLLHQVALGDNLLIGADGDTKLTDFGLSSIPNSAEVKVDPKQQGAQQWKSPE